MINKVSFVLVVIVGVLLYLLIRSYKQCEEGLQQKYDQRQEVLAENRLNWEKLHLLLLKYKNENNDAEKRVIDINSSWVKNELFLRSCVLSERPGSAGAESCKKTWCNNTDSKKQEACLSLYNSLNTITNKNS